MEWLLGFKEFGYPAIMSIALLYILTVKLEQMRDTVINKLDEVEKVLTELRISQLQRTKED